MTIGIPTYNRASKLRRTVKLFADEIIRSHSEDSVEILISDNASPDDTPQAALALIKEFPQLTIRHQRHETNVGATGNFLSCYCNALGEYCWFFADDDIPFPGCLSRILPALAEYAPSAFLFSFVQPLGSTSRTFNFPEPVHVERNPEQCVRIIMQYMKISIYILRKTTLDEPTLNHLHDLRKNAPNYGWGGIGIEVLAACPKAPVVVISEPLASCDDEFVACLDWPVFEWKNEATVFDHPYLRANAPDLYKNRERWTYIMALSFFWGWRSGFLGISNRMAPHWWKSLKRFPAKWTWVGPHFYGLTQLAALKLWPAKLPRFIRGINSFLTSRKEFQ